MSTSFSAHFDGRVIVPDQPVSLPVGQKLQIIVEAAPGQFSDLAKFASDIPDSPGDLAAQHDHYLYGTPKK
ncbi:MAG: hypothetical protein U0805_04845 [Pirellulales bacterium]